MFFTTAIAHADNLKTLLTQSEKAVEARVSEGVKLSMTTNVEVGILSCRKMEHEYKKLKNVEFDSKEFREILKNAQAYNNQCNVDVFVNDKEEVVGIQLTNNSKNNIIDQDSTPNTSNRTYSFRFEDRVTQDMHLDITDDSGLTGKLSHDLMETTIVFIPRKVVPYMEPYEDLGECRQKIILPTEEYVIFDTITKEILSGVLKETPMDLNPNRHQRKFAGIEYTGNGIIIRADRRAGSPEYTYKQAFNVYEKIDKAQITHKGKTCYVAKAMIWENSNNHKNYVHFRYASDQQFLDQVVNPHCGWNLSLSDLE